MTERSQKPVPAYEALKPKPLEGHKGVSARGIGRSARTTNLAVLTKALKERK